MLQNDILREDGTHFTHADLQEKDEWIFLWIISNKNMVENSGFHHWKLQMIMYQSMCAIGFNEDFWILSTFQKTNLRTRTIFPEKHKIQKEINLYTETDDKGKQVV